MIEKRTSGAWRASGVDVVLAAIVVAVAIAGCPGAGLPGAFGQCQYEAFVLEGPECPWPFSGHANLVGTGLNEHGHIAGWWTHCGSDVDEAFYWTPETGIVTLPRPEGVWAAMAHDINDAGIVIGIHWVVGSGALGFAFDPATQEFQYLPPLHDGATATVSSSANAINNNGIVAGSRIIGKPGQSPMPSNAVIWDTNTGEIVDLGIQQGPNSAARDITEAAEFLVGWEGISIPTTIAHVWQGDKTFDLGLVPDTDSSHAEQTSDDGTIVGSGFLFFDLTWRAFVWRNGEMTVIPPTELFSSSRGQSINNVRQAGIMMSSSGLFRAYLWQHGDIHSLNALLVDRSGVTLQTAGSINNSGQILGVSIGSKAVLLTPVDVPFADLNFDCKVNEHDLLMMLAAFGPQPTASGSGGQSPHPADLNGDGIVNVTDLLIMLGNWNS